MYSPVKIKKLSTAQAKRLLKGGSVTIQPGNDIPIFLSNEQLKRFSRKRMQGAGINGKPRGLRVTFDPYQSQYHAINGGGFWGDLWGGVKNVFRKILPIGLDVAQNAFNQHAPNLIGNAASNIGNRLGMDPSLSGQIGNYASNQLGNIVNNGLNSLKGRGAKGKKPKLGLRKKKGPPRVSNAAKMKKLTEVIQSEANAMQQAQMPPPQLTPEQLKNMTPAQLKQLEKIHGGSLWSLLPFGISAISSLLGNGVKKGRKPPTKRKAPTKRGKGKGIFVPGSYSPGIY